MIFGIIYDEMLYHLAVNGWLGSRERCGKIANELLQKSVDDYLEKLEATHAND